MFRKHVFLLALFGCLSGGIAFGQTKSQLEDQAYGFLIAKDYTKAYEVFDQLHARYPKERDYEFKLGICAINFPEKKARSIEIFQDLYAKEKNPEIEYYLARAYHANYQFDEALTTLQSVVETLSTSKKKEDKALLDDANILISNCKNAKILMMQKANSTVVNVGAPVNTKELEGVPVLNADETMMIFTYVGSKSLGGRVNAEMEADPEGQYTSDIYMTTRVPDSTWRTPVPIKSLNTKANDAAVALSPDGTQLFTFLSTNENPGDIYLSKLDGNTFTTPQPLNKNINSPDYWEGSCSISADGKTLYFSSERPEGLGGRDIWMSEWTNGDWGPAVNMGPSINTPLDEDAPFIHPDGVTLFFSSKGHMSMGGYDIMFSSKTDGAWGAPKSMGVPLNTTEDDSYYVLNSKGNVGYFSSDRGGGEGKGSQDIYMVTPGIVGEKLVVALYKGIVYGDDKPVEARIRLTEIGGSNSTFTFSSNESTGKYLFTLKPGVKYKLVVSAEGFGDYEEEIDLLKLSDYKEEEKNLKLYKGIAGKAEEKKTEKVETQTEQEQITKQQEQIAKQELLAKQEEEKRQQAEKKRLEDEKKIDAIAAKIKGEVKSGKPKKNEPGEPAGPCDPTLPDLSPIKGKSLNTPHVYEQMLKLIGTYCSQGTVFKVQLGAYKNPQNFNANKLISLGDIESTIYPDGLTRFTGKEFNTIRDAEKYRQKAIAKGQKDAWIVVFIDGKRYALEDMIEQDFLGKTVN